VAVNPELATHLTNSTYSPAPLLPEMADFGINPGNPQMNLTPLSLIL